MKNISLYIPEVKDYEYEQKINSDPQSMSYNAGYEVSYDGYHYDTGCIDFPKEKWEGKYQQRKKENKYFAYIKDEDLNAYVGYVNYQYNSNAERYECGILIEAKYRKMGYAKKALNLLCQVAKENGVKELYDSFEIERDHTLDLFQSVGFKIVENQTWKKFNKNVSGVLVKIVL